MIVRRKPGVTPQVARKLGVKRKQPALFLIGGITRADVTRDAGLMWQEADPTSMLLLLPPPLPNFLFQRDCSCWIFGGVTIIPMTKSPRG